MVPTQTEQGSEEVSWRKRHIGVGGGEMRKGFLSRQSVEENLERGHAASSAMIGGIPAMPRDGSVCPMEVSWVDLEVKKMVSGPLPLQPLP